jgi:hypothetical protein
VKQPLHAELSRIRDGGGQGSDDAEKALGDGPIGARLRAAMRALAGHRGRDSSTCPSDAARAVGGDTWRDLMPDANAIARDLARSGDVEITQRGDVLDPDGTWRGPIRVRVAAR